MEYRYRYPLACFQHNFFDEQLVFCFQSTVSCQISALMLEPSFLSKVAEFTYLDPEFERFPLGEHSYNAMFRIITVHSINLLYCTPGTGH